MSVITSYRELCQSRRAMIAIVLLATTMAGVQFGPDMSIATARNSPNVHVVSLRRTRDRVPVSRPVSISIPSLDVSAKIIELGLSANHQVQVPPTTSVVGWYKLGPTPGQIGSSVLLAHVDSYAGPGVFFQLKLLTAGQLVRVTLADGVVITFGVLRVVQYSKTNFPDRLIYGSRGFRDLQLVTCGGVFDHATGSYEANIVVFTKFLFFTRPARGV